MVMCEECERKEAETDALVDGEYKRLCSRCAMVSGAVVVEKPSQLQISRSLYTRPKVRQVLSRMAGINKDNYSPGEQRTVANNPYAHLRIPASRKQVSLDDLREVKKANEAENKELNEAVGQIEDVEAEVEENKSKVSWFKGLFSRKKKEEKPEAPAVEGEPVERFNRVRIVNSKEETVNI